MKSRAAETSAGVPFPASPTTTTPAAAATVTGREQPSPSLLHLHPSIHRRFFYHFHSIPIPPSPRIYFFPPLSLFPRALCFRQIPTGLTPQSPSRFPSPLNSLFSPYPRSLNPSPTECISQPSLIPHIAKESDIRCDPHKGTFSSVHVNSFDAPFF